jgi:hypothetical protein
MSDAARRGGLHAETSSRPTAFMFDIIVRPCLVRRTLPHVFLHSRAQGCQKPSCGIQFSLTLKRPPWNAPQLPQLTERILTLHGGVQDMNIYNRSRIIRQGIQWLCHCYATPRLLFTCRGTRGLSCNRSRWPARPNRRFTASYRHIHEGSAGMRPETRPCSASVALTMNLTHGVADL